MTRLTILALALALAAVGQAGFVLAERHAFLPRQLFLVYRVK